ncbi:MAG: FAD-dependent oxidoreductase [Oscillospiraceae bacterium]
MRDCDVTVIGGGPAGLAAAISAKKAGANVVLIEREPRLGGILKQCIHDGFGLMRFGQKLSGPEYAARFVSELHSLDITALTSTFVTRIDKEDSDFCVVTTSRDGLFSYRSGALVLATGCRERTSKQAGIHGTRPAGIFTAGTAQRLLNIDGQLPCKNCVILGSGDIGLIMARRITLEGARVLGVYEVKASPSGLARNISQCLDDFDIPLHLSSTVMRTFGNDRLTAVEIADVDANMKPIVGSERVVECDALILSVGLIPENELAENLGVQLDCRTKGPSCDETLMSNIGGVFSCGNALHVNDLVDYVSESGELAGAAAAHYALGDPVTAHGFAKIECDQSLLYCVPARFCPNSPAALPLYFRSREPHKKSRLVVSVNGETRFEKKFSRLSPPELERVVIDPAVLKARVGDTVILSVSEV